MVAVEVELKCVSPSLKNKTHVQCVAAFHEVTDCAQPNPGMPVRTPVGSIGGMDRLQHSQQSSVRKPTQTPAERRQSCRFHSRRESIPDTTRIPPDRCEAAEDRRIRLPAAATSAEVTPYSTAAYSESESAMGKGIAFRLTTCAKKSSIAERESRPRRAKIGLASESRERDRRMVLVEVAGMSQSDADCATCQLRRSRRG